MPRTIKRSWCSALQETQDKVLARSRHGGWVGRGPNNIQMEQGLQEGFAGPTLLICHFLPTSLPPLLWVSAFALCSLQALSPAGLSASCPSSSSSGARASPLPCPSSQKVVPSRALLLWLCPAAKDITISVSLVRGGSCCSGIPSGVGYGQKKINGSSGSTGASSVQSCLLLVTQQWGQGFSNSV